MLKDGDLELRAMEPEDLELLLALENDSTLWQWGGSNVPYSRYILRQYLEQNQNDIYADGQVRMVIAVDGKAAGLVDLVNFDARNARAEVGIVLLPSFRRMGYAHRSLSLLSEYAFRFLRLRQLYAFVSVCNSDALQLFTSAGYEKTSCLRDWLAREDAYVDAALFVLLSTRS